MSLINRQSLPANNQKPLDDPALDNPDSPIQPVPINITDHRSPDDPVHIITPYEVLASLYDNVMSHVDYVVWADFALSVLSDYGLMDPRSCDSFASDDSASPRLLECACGTGTLAVILALNGCQIDAFDKSPEMIKVARAKASHLRNPPQFTIADFQTFCPRWMTRTDLPQKYDAALCLYDSINYLMEPDHIRTFLIRVFQSLIKNGLFLFDVCTVFNSKRFFFDQIENLRGIGYKCIRKMRFDSRRMIQENIFVIQQGNLSDVFIEKHYQRIYSLPVIRRLITESGFYILEEMDGQNRRPPHKRSLRVHFLCRRPPH